MTLKNFDLLIYDVFGMDDQFPPITFKWSKEFEKRSCTKYMVDELRMYVYNAVYPRHDFTLTEIINIVYAFKLKMLRYSKLNENTRLTFEYGVDLANDVLDILESMI